jgi:hypothetical protein
MFCCDNYTPNKDTADFCEECGGAVDVEGKTTQSRCEYSPVICDKCGLQPCAGSC